MADERLKVGTIIKKQTDMYHFRFKPSGWALVFIDEPTGTLAIHSDWGDWAFSWPNPGRGTGTLKQFLANGSYDYLAGKLTMGKQDEFDLDASRNAMYVKLQSAVDVLRITRKEHKELVTELEDSHEQSPELWVERWSRGLSEALGECPWEEFIHTPNRDFLSLRDRLLPAIVHRLTLSYGEKALGEPECPICHKEIHPALDLWKKKCPHCGHQEQAPDTSPSTAGGTVGAGNS